MTGNMEKGSYIAERRKELGMSQVRAAREVGVSLGTWLLWERQVGHPNEQNLKELARVLKVDKAVLLPILKGNGMLQ